MVLGKIGHQLRGGGDLVEGIVPALLLAQHGSEGEVQRGVFGIGSYGLAKCEFGFVKALCAGVAGGLNQRSAESCRPEKKEWASSWPSSRHELRWLGASRFQLADLFLAGKIGNAALFKDADQAVGWERRQYPRHQLRSRLQAEAAG